MKTLDAHFRDDSRASLALARFAHDDDERDAMDTADTLRAERFALHIEDDDTEE